MIRANTGSGRGETESAGGAGRSLPHVPETNANESLQHSSLIALARLLGTAAAREAVASRVAADPDIKDDISSASGEVS